MQVLNDHYDAIAERTRGELRDVVSYGARWTELAWRISVDLNAGEHGAEAHAQKLSPEWKREERRFTAI